MELQQSPMYRAYIQSLKWNIVDIDTCQLFYRSIPFTGVFAKLQRPSHLPNIDKLTEIIHKLHIQKLAIEPSEHVTQNELTTYIEKLKTTKVTISHSPFLPTKTIRVDLCPTENEIFQSFSEAKRRAVRRAQKNNVTVSESHDINLLIQTKNRSAGFLGFITTFGITNLWKYFPRQYTGIVLAYTPNQKKPVGGILLIYWEQIAYYWIAGATKYGKKLFAPTLLVWEAMKVAKRHGCREFDFVGVWDERMPNENRSWLGFTKFKEGFGGKELYYPVASL